MEEQKYVETDWQGKTTLFRVGNFSKGRLVKKGRHYNAFITEMDGESCFHHVCMEGTKQQAITRIQIFGFEPSTRYMIKIKEKGKPIFFETKEGLVDYCKSNSIVPYIVTMQVLKNTWVIEDHLSFLKDYDNWHDFLKTFFVGRR